MKDMTNNLKYEQAVAELETIVKKMENDELDIDSLAEQLKRAKQLIQLCKDKLTKTDEEIQKILVGLDMTQAAKRKASVICFAWVSLCRPDML